MTLVCVVSPYVPAVGDRVLVPTDGGTEVAECVWAAQWVGEYAGLPVLAGLAGPGEEDRRRRRADHGQAAGEA